jgi:tRNA 2-thiouridine synthesizing protein E
MKILSASGKEYHVDSMGFLADPEEWDDEFPDAVAASAGANGPLSPVHRQVLHFIRDSFRRSGRCPLIFETCRENSLSLADLKQLFPSGYLRGACKLAGLTYKETYWGYMWPKSKDVERSSAVEDKHYGIDVFGFLVNPEEWDERYAAFRALDLKMSGGLTDRHWAVLYYLRDFYKVHHQVPTVYETCETNALTLDELEKLFPDGYHRGAVKLAGLRTR